MKNPSVLFVSNTSRHARPYYDPSTRYRCFNFAQSLSAKGFPTACTTQAIFQKQPSFFSNYDYFVFHRPALTAELAEFILSMPTERLIADFDDLNFSVIHAIETPAVRTRSENVSTVSKSLAKIAGAASLFTQFSSSTVPLADYLSRLFSAKKSVVIHNGVDPTFAGISEMVRERNPISHRPYTFAYFPGTASHNPDLQMIEEPLQRALASDSSFKLMIAGPVKIPNSLTRYADQIYKADYVAFHELPNLMAKSKFVLGPLEETEFNQCKSGLKFFEAALSGCTVIGSPIPDIDRFESILLRKCRTSAEWQQALLEPITHSENELEDAARSVDTEVSSDKQTAKWISEFIEQ
ncbi:glycosyltransferase family protein [Pseudomonas putida]|uniref:glycosyltransferase family protein n=1 Tax=Pseudomonas putida TaxID=303 RepID=UPI001F516E8B|nr:hypothetical protein [Pseudomonas putida]MCI0910753.1 hypothetical protein [Pseudomonas putida]